MNCKHLLILIPAVSDLTPLRRRSGPRRTPDVWSWYIRPDCSESGGHSRLSQRQTAWKPRLRRRNGNLQTADTSASGLDSQSLRRMDRYKYPYLPQDWRFRFSSGSYLLQESYRRSTPCAGVRSHERRRASRFPLSVRLFCGQPLCPPPALDFRDHLPDSRACLRIPWRRRFPWRLLGKSPDVPGQR